MRIIYADDTPVLLNDVCNQLRSLGHDAIALETDNLLEFQDRLNFMLEDGFEPDVLILGGRSILRDSQGTPLLDLNAFAFSLWLNKQTNKQRLKNTRLILFSRHAEIREAAQRHPEWGFSTIIAKNEPQALPDLLKAVIGSPSAQSMTTTESGK